ncbi:hypothetical protein Tco_1439978 [Tanacetum coccineum]
MDEAASNEEDEGNELYKDLDVNLEGRDMEMTDDQPNNSSSVSSGFVSNMLNPRPDTGIDSIFNTEATSLVDVPVTTIAEPPLVFATTLPPPPTPLTHMQQTQVPTPIIGPSSSLQDLPNFGSLFGFNQRLKTLETEFFEFKQTNQFAKTVSSIPDIVDAYLANKMHEAVKTVVQLQSERLRDEAQAENEDFLNKLDDNIKKIINNQVKEQVKAQVSKILPKIKKTVNEQLEAEVMTRSSTESKTSLTIAANLSELELKKILIEKMESNKSINRSNAEMMRIKMKNPPLDQIGGSKRRRAGKEPESTSAPKEKTSKTTGKSTDGSKSQHKSAGESAHTEEPMHTDKDLKEPTHQEFDIGATKEQSDEETSQHPDWFQKPAKPRTPDRDWNKTLPAIHTPVQPWLSNLAREKGPRKSFDELMDTPLDFSTFMMNRLKIDTLTPELLAGPTFELMKGTCKSLVELEYFFEEVYKATTDRLDWHNLEVIPFDHFINNDLAYLSGGVSSRTYATSVTKTQAADYGHIKWIEDLVPNTMWSEVSVNYDKHALWEFLIGDENVNNSMDLLLIGNFLVTDDDKLTNLNVKDRRTFGVSLRMFTRSIVIQRRVEDLQLGVESYQKKLNITKPDTYRSDLKRKDVYSAYFIPRGFIYLNKDKKNKLMRIDELHKFSDGTLDDVRTALNGRLKGIRMEYLPKTI